MGEESSESQKLKAPIPWEQNDAICMAPWTHTYISPQSERRLCCASRESHQFIHQYIDQDGESGGEYRPQTLKEHWNSDFMRSIRKKMLNGEKPVECQVCNDQVLNLHTYKMYFNNTLFPHLKKEVFENTSEDGSTSLKPISFDYRVSNLCDFKCRMCGPQLSSSWESERIKEDATVEIWMKPPFKKQIKDFQKEIVEEELREAVHSGEVREIYWVGGEPLIWPIHWELMSVLVDKGYCKDTFIRYNTNLHTIQRNGIQLYTDWLQHFQGINIGASMDGTGEVAEFIRTGLDWKKWHQNFESGLFLNEIFGQDALVWDLTITLPGLLDMKNIIDQINHWDVKVYTKIVFDFDPSVVLSPFALPQPILHSVLDEMIEYCEPRTNEKNQSLLATLKEMKNRPVFSDKYAENFQQGLSHGKEFHQSIAERRGDGQNGKVRIEDILERRPEVLQWWESI